MTNLLVGLLALVSPSFVADHEVIFAMVVAGNSLGSGVVVSKTPLVVATCFHVIGHESSVTVSVPVMNRTFQVTSVAAYPHEDLAFLKIAGQAWSEQRDWRFSPPVLDDQVSVVGFAHADRSHPTSWPLRVAHAETKIQALARLYGTKVPYDFNVVDLVAPKPFRRGDSGGPVFDSASNLIGLAAGRNQPPGSDDSASFALRPLRQLPKDADFLPVAQATNDDGAYVTGGAMFPTGLVLAVGIVATNSLTPPQGAPGNHAPDGGATEATSTTAAQSDCARSIADALDELSVAPPKSLPADGNISDPCRAAYGQIRDVEIALRAEHAATRNLKALSSRLRESESSVRAQSINQMKDVIAREHLSNRPVRNSYARFCDGVESWNHDRLGVEETGCSKTKRFEFADNATVWDGTDETLLEKTAVEMARHGDFFRDDHLAETIVLPPRQTFRPPALGAGANEKEGVRVAAARRESGVLLKQALGTSIPETPREVAPVVGANAVDSTRKNSSDLVGESAVARAKGVEALAELRDRLIRQAGR